MSRDHINSWFRNDPHRWPIASLPFGYASACVEVVIKSSKKAGIIYSKTVEAWMDPDVKAFCNSIATELLSASELEKIKDALVHPEKYFFPDPNKPFKDLETMFNGQEINEDFLKDDNSPKLSLQEQKEVEQTARLICLILEFIIVGFNRKSEIDKGRYRVIPTEKMSWLTMAVMIRTAFDSQNITLERLRRIYLLNKYKGKVIDFHEVVTEQPMSRWHRRIVASGKTVNLKLKNDKVFMNAARAWYGCRVQYGSIGKYCDAKAEQGMLLDPKNVERQIRPCDDALGYIRRLPKKNEN